YVRKSPSDVDPETRLKLLQKMIDNLLERSLAGKVYVSVSSNASLPFKERDSNKTDEIMKKLKHVTGNTPGMLEYLQCINHNICLASIDFAGICSRSYLVKDLLEEFSVIKKIAIETFISDNEIHLLGSLLFTYRYSKMNLPYRSIFNLFFCHTPYPKKRLFQEKKKTA
ncbi:hypothetical protein BD770DRAFT_320275, partial [Pilaira anomala]